MSRMRYRVPFLVLVFVLSISVTSAQTKADKMQVVRWMEGIWEGALNFKIFREDSLRDEVLLRIVGELEGDKVNLKYTYFKDGNVVREGDGKVMADDDDNTFLFNDRWQVEGFNRSDDQFIIILLGKGRDNNKRAELRKTITISAESLTIKRDVKYRNRTEFFNRHTYSLKKVIN